MKVLSKNILITGVSTGIGYGAAKHFIERGYAVFGGVRNQQDGDRLKAELGAQFEPLLFDVTDSEAVSKAAKHLTQRLGVAGWVD